MKMINSILKGWSDCKELSIKWHEAVTKEHRYNMYSDNFWFWLNFGSLHFLDSEDE